ncbi:MAG: AAA family ATPase [Pseudomonadota bacterium]
MHLLEKVELVDVKSSYIRNKVLCTLLTVCLKDFQKNIDIDILLDTYDGMSAAILSIATTNGGSISFQSTDIMHISFFAGDSSIFHTNRALEAALQINQYLMSVELNACFAIDVGFCVYMTAGSEKFYESVMCNTAVVNENDTKSGILLSDSALDKLVGIETQLGSFLTAKGKRYQALLSTSPTEQEQAVHFIGRDLELVRLQFFMEEAVRSKGTACAIIGEAGIGKSTLLDNFLERKHLYKIRTGFSPENSSLLHLLASIVAQIIHNDGIYQLDNQAIDYITSKFFIKDKLFCDAINYIFNKPTESSEWALLDNSVKISKSVEVLIDIIGSISKDRICAFIIEDIHWAQKSVLEYIIDIMHALQGNRILFIFTSRSIECINDLGCINVISLIPFNRHEVHLLYHTLVPSERDSLETRTAIDKCNGNPFYTAETIKYINSDHFQSISVPNTIQDIILARVNALPHAEQQLLRFASILGFEFSLKQVCQIFSLEAASLQHVAKSLVRKGFLYRSGLGLVYIFTHELKRIAIYSAVLHSDKISFHQKALRYYMAYEPSNICSIALHAYESGDYQAAYEANLAVYDMAIDNYDSALALTAISRCELIAAPDALKLSHLSVRRLRAQLLKGDASLLQKTLRELSRPTKERLPEQNVAEIEGASWLCKWMAGDYQSAIQDIMQAKQVIKPGTELSITASIRLAGIYSDIGEYGKSTDVLNKLRDEISLKEDYIEVTQLTFPYIAAIEAIQARNDACLGMTESALTRCHKATGLCSVQKNKVSQLFAMCYTAEAYIICNKLDQAKPLIQDAVSIVNEKEIDILFGYASVLSGYLMSLEKRGASIRVIRNGIQSCMQRNQMSRVSLYYYYMTKSLLFLGDEIEAKKSISQAISLSTRYQENGVLLLSLKLANEYKLLPEHMDVTKEIETLAMSQFRQTA